MVRRGFLQFLGFGAVSGAVSPSTMVPQVASNVMSGPRLSFDQEVESERARDRIDRLSTYGARIHKDMSFEPDLMVMKSTAVHWRVGIQRQRDYERAPLRVRLRRQLDKAMEI